MTKIWRFQQNSRSHRLIQRTSAHLKRKSKSFITCFRTGNTTFILKTQSHACNQRYAVKEINSYCKLPSFLESTVKWSCKESQPSNFSPRGAWRLCDSDEETAFLEVKLSFSLESFQRSEHASDCTVIHPFFFWQIFLQRVSIAQVQDVQKLEWNFSSAWSVFIMKLESG